MKVSYFLRIGLVAMAFMASIIIAQEQQQDVIAEGVGLGANQSEALMNAKRDAVEKGIGMVLLSQTEIENFMLKRDQVITKTMGSVKSYDKLSETQTQDNLYEIKIKAVLSRVSMHEDLAAFHILLETMDKPRVMVIVEEKNCGDVNPDNKSAENAIIAFLKSPYDFELVDPSVVESIRGSQEKMAKLRGDDAAAAAIGATYGAEVIIKGGAEATVAEGMTQNLGGMKSVQADVALRAINCTSGRIIASGSGHGAKVHVSPTTAGVNAIKAASEKAVKSLLDAVIEDWNKQVNNGISLSVSVKGVTSFRDKNAVLQSLQAISGVAAVRERAWSGESGLLETDITYKGNSGGFCTKADGFKLSQGGGSFLVGGVTGTRVSLAVQVK
jgi:hypothetical protein